MDALRLIKTTRHALAEARTVADVLSEAWQSASLTAVLAERLSGHPAEEVATVARLLARAGGHAVGLLEAVADPPDGGDRATFGRADRLTRIGELGPVLEQLRLLFAEVAEALVAIADSTDSAAQGVYWLAIDGLDASGECRALVIELLRTLRRRAVVEPLEELDADSADGGPPRGERWEASWGSARWGGPPGPASWSAGGRTGGPPSRVPGPANFDEPMEEATAAEDPAAAESVAAAPAEGESADSDPADGDPAEGCHAGVARGREADPAGDELRLVITLTPPPGQGYQPTAPVPVSVAPERSAARRAPEASSSSQSSPSVSSTPDAEPRAGPSSAPSPARSARSALTEASSSCSWSSRLLAGCCGGATGASYLGSDMKADPPARDCDVVRRVGARDPITPTTQRSARSPRTTRCGPPASVSQPPG
ncbi:DUF6099 family protein [Kitasatospora sp. GAS1066B]|uniref:DUF6099 family protein n=1 Tax=Kitasatospora sp. GAS1066B TaxID=3156271 RepID=UPI00351807BC